MDRIFSDYGIVLKTEPISEYDRRLVILTKDHGKVYAFAKGARRNNKLTAAADYFCFGKFKFYTGASSLSVLEAEITNYFEELRNDYEKAMYGTYFLEVTDYVCKENNDEEQILILLYQSLRALTSNQFNASFVKMIFELKTMMLGGEFSIDNKSNYLSGTVYTLEYIYGTAPNKLFSFEIKKEIFDELERICSFEKKKIWNRTFNSEFLLKTIEN